MESLVDISLVALAVATLAAAVSAALTRTRVQAWSLTAALLWLGTAALTASALVNAPVAIAVVGWLLAGAAVLVAASALFGRPAHADRAPLEVRHALNAR